jgi:hypothetical protein
VTTDEGMQIAVEQQCARERKQMSNMPLTWLIEALRSNHYTQGRGKLASRGDGDSGWKYCCLGVACELYQVHVGGLSIDASGKFKTYDREESHLPEKVRKWLGFDGNGGEFVERQPSPDGRDRRADRVREVCPTAPAAVPREDKTYENLVDANDDGYFTFAEIANILEAGQVRPEADVA